MLAGTERDAPPDGSPTQAQGTARLPPPPLRGGPLALLRFMAANNMLRRQYAGLLLRLAYLKLRHRGRLKTDGLCFICPGVTLEIGRGAACTLAAGPGSATAARSASTRAKSASAQRR